MSPRSRTPDKPLGQDLVDAPYLDGEERAEVAWLLAREVDPTAAPPSREVAREHRELQHLLRTLPTPQDDGWQHELTAKLRALEARPARWWQAPWARWLLGGPLAAAAVLLLWLAPRARAPLQSELAGPDARGAARHDELTVELQPMATAYRRDALRPAVGDEVALTTAALVGGELRVFRGDGALVARCPGAPRCQVGADGSLRLELTLTAPGRYHVILAIGGAPAAAGASLDEFLAGALASGARLVTPEPLEVR